MPLQFLQSMLLNQAFGIYVAVLVEERGWSKTSLSAAAALKSTEVALLGPILGWLVDRFGSHGLVRIGIVMFGIGFMLLSRIETLVGFYAAFVVIALGSSMFSNLLVSVAIIHWFEKHRTRALSALQFGGAIGGLFVFLVAWSIQSFGWRPTAFGSGVIAIVLGWPLASMIRSRPADVGETVDGLPQGQRTSGSAHRPRVYGSAGPTHQCVLDALARPRFFFAGGDGDQRARDYAYQGRTGLFAVPGFAIFYIGDIRTVFGGDARLAAR